MCGYYEVPKGKVYQVKEEAIKDCKTLNKAGPKFQVYPWRQKI